MNYLQPDGNMALMFWHDFCKPYHRQPKRKPYILVISGNISNFAIGN